MQGLRLPQCRMSRLVVSGSCVSLSEAGEKTGPIGADIFSKVRETTPGRLDSLLHAPSPDKYRGQLVGSLAIISRSSRAM